MKLVDVRKIWDQAPHNAFTDLVNFEGRFFAFSARAKGTSRLMVRCALSPHPTA